MRILLAGPTREQSGTEEIANSISHGTALVAALFGARADVGRALLRRLLQSERRVALRAGFSDGLVPVDGVALRILRAAVEVFPALRLLHQKLAAAAGPRATPGATPARR